MLEPPEWKPLEYDDLWGIDRKPPLLTMPDWEACWKVIDRMESRTDRRRFLSMVVPCFAVLGTVPRPVSGWAGAPRPCGLPESRSLRWIIPNAVGGSSDTFSRMLQPFLERRFGLVMRPHNIPGASGIVGARSLKMAPPDGMTLGIMSAPGLLAAFLSGTPGCPDPLADFEFLCRIARSRHVWVSGSRSQISNIDAALDIARRRPLVFGLNNVGGVSFIDAAVTSHLLGVDVVFVSGYGGSRETSLAAIRGEVDLVALSWESLADRIGNRELNPILLIDDDTHGLDGVPPDLPVLGGSSGVLATRPVNPRVDRQQLLRDGRALIRLIGAGRVIAGPAGLSSDLRDCLEAQLLETLRDSGFLGVVQKGDRSIDIGTGAEARADIVDARERVDRFLPVLAAALDQVRGLRPPPRSGGA